MFTPSGLGPLPTCLSPSATEGASEPLEAASPDGQTDGHSDEQPGGKGLALLGPHWPGTRGPKGPGRSGAPAEPDLELLLHAV